MLVNMLLLFAPGVCETRGGGTSVPLFHHGERGLITDPSLTDQNLLLGDKMSSEMRRISTTMATASQSQIEQEDVIFCNCCDLFKWSRAADTDCVVALHWYSFPETPQSPNPRHSGAQLQEFQSGKAHAPTHTPSTHVCRHADHV